MKKLFSVLLLIALITCTASAAEIYSYTNETQLTGGAVLKNIKRFYADYSLNISCISADLKKENLSLQLLKSDKGCDKLDTVLNLANGEEDVVAATNADFFSSYKGDQNFSLGIEIKDGNLIQSHINSDMAAGFLTEDGLMLSYMDFSAEIITPNETTLPVTHINKPTDYYGALLMYTASFNGGVSPFLPSGITAVTVTDGVVTSKGISLGGTLPIPENGYILAIDDNMTPMLGINLNVDDKVNMKVNASPSLEKVTTAFGGGTMLLKDGKKTKITHAVNGNHPRTVIGTNEDGTVVYLVTVDGRQKISRGVSLDALSDICLELGIVNALNLDGGGSTAMVGKPLSSPSLTTLNSPSETRKVINGIAVVSDAKPQDPAGFELNAENNFVLVKDSVKLSFTAYDENYHPAETSPQKITWKVSGVKGVVKDNIFYPETEGKAQLDLYYDKKLMNSVYIDVLGEVCGINTPKEITLSEGKSTELTAEIFDFDGNTAPVKDISLLNPKYDSSFIKLDKNKITLLKNGAGLLTLTHSGAARTIKINNFGEAIPESVTNDLLLTKKTNGEKFTVLPFSPVKTLFDRVLYSHTARLFSSHAFSMPGGENIPDLNKNGNAPVLTNSFSGTTLKNTRVVSLNVSNNSLRIDGQWSKFKEEITGASENNLILLLKSAPEFSDKLEADVFHDILRERAKDKCIFVVYSGGENKSVIKDGIRYISLAGREAYPSLSASVSEMKYLSFNLADDGITYTFENVFENKNDGKYAIVLE